MTAWSSHRGCCKGGCSCIPGTSFITPAVPQGDETDEEAVRRVFEDEWVGDVGNFTLGVTPTQLTAYPDAGTIIHKGGCTPGHAGIYTVNNANPQDSNARFEIHLDSTLDNTESHTYAIVFTDEIFCDEPGFSFTLNYHLRIYHELYKNGSLIHRRIGWLRLGDDVPSDSTTMLAFDIFACVNEERFKDTLTVLNKHNQYGLSVKGTTGNVLITSNGLNTAIHPDTELDNRMFVSTGIVNEDDETRCSYNCETNCQSTDTLTVPQSIQVVVSGFTGGSSFVPGSGHVDCPDACTSLNGTYILELGEYVTDSAVAPDNKILTETAEGHRFGLQFDSVLTLTCNDTEWHFIGLLLGISCCCFTSGGNIVPAATMRFIRDPLSGSGNDLPPFFGLLSSDSNNWADEQIVITNTAALGICKNDDVVAPIAKLTTLTGS